MPRACLEHVMDVSSTWLHLGSTSAPPRLRLGCVSAASRRPVDVHRRRVAVAATRDEAEEAGEAEAVVSVRVRHKDAVDAPN